VSRSGHLHIRCIRSWAPERRRRYGAGIALVERVRVPSRFGTSRPAKPAARARGDLHQRAKVALITDREARWVSCRDCSEEVVEVGSSFAATVTALRRSPLTGLMRGAPRTPTCADPVRHRSTVPTLEILGGLVNMPSRKAAKLFQSSRGADRCRSPRRVSQGHSFLI